MTAPALDERLHRDALTTLTGKTDVFDYGTVPGLDGNKGTTPRIHWLLSVERTFVEARKMCEGATRSGWRASIRHVGRTPDEARFAQLVISEAFDGARITVDDVTSTRIAHETTQAIEPDDDGWFSGLTVWTYVL